MGIMQDPPIAFTKGFLENPWVGCSTFTLLAQGIPRFFLKEIKEPKTSQPDTVPLALV
jgi:hypothetical protein